MPAHRSFSLNGETLILDDEARALIPAKFLRLPGGTTCYELDGPEGGPAVVFVHGFSVPNYLWDKNFSVLAEAGFRVLRYDLLGRGYSDRPDVDYGADLYDRQLVDLLETLKMRTPVHLVGSSMGGIVASIFADRHPHLVDKLVLIDPAGMLNPPNFPKSTMPIPIVGEVLMNLFGNNVLIPGIVEDLIHPEAFPEYRAKYLPQMKYIGFKRALLSTMRSKLLYDQDEVYARLGQQKRSILLIWGKEDRIIPLEIGKRIKEALPQAVLRVIEDVGHVPHYERPEVVNPMLIDFLRGADFTPAA